MKMSAKFTCRFCKEQFDQPKGLYKHLQSAHSAGSSTDNRTCPICGVLCSKYEGYRDHLLYIHGQSNEGQKLTFKSLNEFLLWKTELEIKYRCKYVLQSAPKVLSTKEKKYFYQCDASNSRTKEKKSMSVIMKQCSSVISVVEGTGVFKVEYWDTHSGHAVRPQISVENELEAAISSVEMVNAIGESDDSEDKAEEVAASQSQTSFEVRRAIEKPSFLKSSSGINSAGTLVTPKTKTVQIAPKPDQAKKKSSNMLFSLASVACGKGIAKKPAAKLNKNDAEKVHTEKVVVSSDIDKIKTVSSPMKNKNGTITLLSTPAKPAIEITPTTTANTTTANTTVANTTVAKTSSVPSTFTSKFKITAPKSNQSLKGPQAIAPKITSVSGGSVNSLFSANSAFSNQLVIVNPLGLDPNSNQNAASAGQNIVLSLPLGQNILPASTTSQTVEKPTDNVSDVSSKIAGSLNTYSKSKPAVQKAGSSKSILSNGTPSTSSVTPITLATGMKNAPVVLSSLPVGSTFMSVNNNLIPIATPSGTFLPTSLPPNIVLTPVVSTVGNISTKTLSTTVKSQTLQNQVHSSVTSTPAGTVSSVRKEPIYSSTPMKNSSKVSMSSAVSPISSTSPKTFKSVNKSKSKNAVTKLLSSPNKDAPTSLMPILNKFAASGELSITATPASPSAASKAKKRFSKGSATVAPAALREIKPMPVKTKSSSAPVTKAGAPASTSVKSTPSGVIPIINNAFSINMGKPVPSTATTQMLLPLTNSISNFTLPAQTFNNRKFGTGTLLFESSGDVFMLEPIDSQPAQRITKEADIPKIPKVDKSVQTFENLNLPTVVPKSKLQRKRTADPDDDVVMMKVKCYQLEMKYMNSKTDCKKLKLELTKEKMKNAELTGEKVELTEEDDDDKSRTKASEIMKEIEDKYSEGTDTHIYTMTKTSVLRTLYEDLEELCVENSELHKELENYRAHDKFYKNLKKKLYEEDFES